MRWCLRGRMTCQSCRRVTQRGSPKYVCDHLWIWLVKVQKMIRQKMKHSQGYSCSRASAGWGEGGYPQGPHHCHMGWGLTPSLAFTTCPGQLPPRLAPRCQPPTWPRASSGSPLLSGRTLLLSKHEQLRAWALESQSWVQIPAMTFPGCMSLGQQLPLDILASSSIKWE